MKSFFDPIDLDTLFPRYEPMNFCNLLCTRQKRFDALHFSRFLMQYCALSSAIVVGVLSAAKNQNQNQL